MLPQDELDVNEKLKEERGISNSSYAIKLVEKVVFSAIKIIVVAVLMALIGLVIKQQL